MVVKRSFFVDPDTGDEFSETHVNFKEGELGDVDAVRSMLHRTSPPGRLEEWSRRVADLPDNIPETNLAIETLEAALGAWGARKTDLLRSLESNLVAILERAQRRLEGRRRRSGAAEGGRASAETKRDRAREAHQAIQDAAREFSQTGRPRADWVALIARRGIKNSKGETYSKRQISRILRNMDT